MLLVRILVTVFISTIIPFSSEAQILTIKDREDLHPLELVTLVSFDGKVSAVSNQKGEVELNPFYDKNGIEIRRLGYQTKRTSYDVLKSNKFIVLLNPKALESEQVIVSVSRWNEKNDEVAQRVSILGAKELMMQQPQTAADFLAATGQVFIQKSQLGGGSPMIRGFATNRVLISVDGIRMNNAIFRSGNLQNVINIDPFTLHQTEVLFGPASVMYGSDAIGGVMDFSTINAKFSPDTNLLVKGNTSTRYSSANQEKTGHIGLQVGSKNWSSYSAFTYSDFGDLRMGSNGPDDYLRTFYVETENGTDVSIVNGQSKIQKPTAFSQYNVLQKINFRPNLETELSYSFRYSTTSDYPRYDRLLRTRRGNPRSAVWNYGPQEWLMHAIKLEKRSESDLFDTMVSRISYQQFEESRIDRDFNDSIERTRTEAVDALSFSIDFIKEWNQQKRLTYGFEAIYNDVKSEGFDVNTNSMINVDAQARYPNSQWSSYAAFVTYQHKFNEKLKVLSGLRYNLYILDSKFSTDFYPFPFTSANLNDGALTGSLGLLWNPISTISVSTNLSTGFRTPNVDDIGKVFDSEPGSVVVPNPNLSSEYVYSLDIGLSQRIESILNWDVSVFYSILENALVRRDFVFNGVDSIEYNGELSQVQAIQNAAEARVWGIQAGLDVNLSRGFTVQNRFSYQQGEEELDNGTVDPLRHAAPWFASSKLTYSFQRFRSELSFIYNAEIASKDLAEEEKSKDYLYAKDGLGNPYSPSWYIVTIKSVYQLDEHWTVSAGIENMLDKRYQPYSSGIAGAGRNVIIAVKAGF